MGVAPKQTYEGDNGILMLQTGRWLVKTYEPTAARPISADADVTSHELYDALFTAGLNAAIDRLREKVVSDPTTFHQRA
jgi:hypothetical protein